MNLYVPFCIYFREKFRPAYGHLGILANVFPNVPIVAMTATATEDTQAKIIESIGLDNPTIVKVNPDRPNIYFSCQKKKTREMINWHLFWTPFKNWKLLYLICR